MEKKNVLLLAPLTEKKIRLIKETSIETDVRFSSRVLGIPDLKKGAHKQEYSSPEYEKELAWAEVFYGYVFPHRLTMRAPNLKWIQGMLAGVDILLTEEVVNSHITVTNTRGIHATPVGEIAVALMMMLAKKGPFIFNNKLQHKWESYMPNMLRSQTVGILGLGAIGNEIARISKALGMRVLGIRRTARTLTRARFVDMVFPASQLHEMLAQCDYVMVVLPATPETNKMIGKNELKVMKPTAYLINVGRGQTVDEEVLAQALEEEWIAGAGLDAFTIEPLPSDSKLWQLPNVIITPHVGGHMLEYEDAATEVFVDNLKRYLVGKKLHNIVNKKAGY